MHNQFKTYKRYLIIGIGIFSLWSTTACSRLANRHGVGTILREQSPEAEAQKRRKEIAKFYKVLRPEVDVADIEDINIKDSSGKTLLHYAVERGDLNIINGLLNIEGIDVNITDNLVRTPLHYAAILFKSYILDALLKRADLNANIQDRYDMLPLHYAAWGDVNMAIKLLPVTNNINASDKGGNTSLHYAVNRLIRLESYAVDYEGRDSLISAKVIDAAECLLKDISMQYAILKATKNSAIGKASMFYPTSTNKIGCWRARIDENVSEKLAALRRFPMDDVNKKRHQRKSIENLTLINELLRAGADAHIYNKSFYIEADGSLQEKKGMSPLGYIEGFRAEERAEARKKERKEEGEEAKKKERGKIKPVTLDDLSKMIDAVFVVVDGERLGVSCSVA